MSFFGCYHAPPALRRKSMRLGFRKVPEYVEIISLKRIVLVFVMETGTEMWQIILMRWLVPVAMRSKAWVCGRPSAGIVGSNSTRGMDVCLLCVVR